MRRTNIEALKILMVKRNISSIVDLAAKSGLNRNTLGDILSGKIQPSAHAMGKLVETLHIEPEKAGEIFFANNLPNEKVLY